MTIVITIKLKKEQQQQQQQQQQQPQSSYVCKYLFQLRLCCECQQ